MRRWLVLIVIILIAIFVLRKKPRHEQVEEVPDEPIAQAPIVSKKKPKPISVTKEAPKVSPPPPQQQKATAVANPDPNSERAAHFKLEDGVAVVAGDIVVGQIDNSPPTGNVLLPKVYLWKRSEIAYGVVAAMPNPERIQKALEMFEGTAVKFVPIQDSDVDGIIFVEGTGHCKSYVGKVRGKQPIWIAPECDADDIAHEIMHALGFVHEQNRSDRDNYVEILTDNIEPEFKFNFDKLPSDFTKLSETSPFAYDSIMIYSADAFAKKPGPTMKSKDSRHEIAPSRTLSREDIERINGEYGKK